MSALIRRLAWDGAGDGAVAVAIPARDEADRIDLCLLALAGQVGARLDHAVVLLNNCRDGSADVVRRLMPYLPFRVTLLERDYPESVAHVGTARREALACAAQLVGPDGVLLTTDADGRVAPDWLAANLDALAAGADVVCGRAVIDPDEARLIPQALHDDDALEVAYGRLLDRIHALVDPDPADPWPRHTEHSGASIAVRAAAWTLVDGLPALRSGEDRAFLDALRRMDRRIRHAPEVMVTVSGRTTGRAPGGMAETMARRMLRQDEMLDDTLEPARRALRRAALRARLRLVWETGASPGMANAATRLGITRSYLAASLDQPYFGMAWAKMAQDDPRLAWHPVRRADCVRQTHAAERIVARLEAASGAMPQARMRGQEPAPRPALQAV